MANRACLVALDITHCVSTALTGRTVCPLGSALLCYAFAVKTGDLDYELPETIKRGSTKCRRIMPLMESAFTLDPLGSFPTGARNSLFAVQQNILRYS